MKKLQNKPLLVFQIYGTLDDKSVQNTGLFIVFFMICIYMTIIIQFRKQNKKVHYKLLSEN